MRAALVRAYGAVENLAIEDVEFLHPRVGEVVIETSAIDTNYPDLLVVEGRYQVKPPLPFAPGKCAVGRISEIGEGVKGFEPGQRVLAMVEYGAYAEQVRAPAALCHAVPDDVADVQAALLGLAYQTAWFALLARGGFQPGQSVMVLGANGAVGAASVQLARSLGAAKVIAVIRNLEGADGLYAAGADLVVAPAESELREALKASASSLTEGRGVDVVIDPVGGAYNEPALRALAWNGRLVLLGFAAGGPPTIRGNYLLVKNIGVSGLQWSDYRDREPAAVAQAQRGIFALARAGLLKPQIAGTLPFEAVREALIRFREGRTGKVIVEIRR